MGCANGKYKSLIDQLKEENLGPKRMESDGNCLFRAVSHQLEGSQENYGYYRKMACKCLREQEKEFIEFLEKGVSYQGYVKLMEKDKTWGGNLELFALSLYFNIEIQIYMSYQPKLIISKTPYPKKTIKLAYRKYNHYFSVVSRKEMSTCVWT